MPTNSILPPYPSFFDLKGAPLEYGSIYIGVAGFEARTTPKASFFDIALTIPTGTASGAAIATKAGYPVRNAAPAAFYVDGDYSITVLDRFGALVYTALNNTLAIDLGGLQVNTIAELYTVTAARIPVGGYAYVRSLSASYKRVSSGGNLGHTASVLAWEVVIPPSGMGQLSWFGGVAGTDCTSAMAAALAVCNVAVGPGIWKFNYLAIPANRTITGAEWLTIFEPTSTSIRAIFTCDSGSASAFVDNVKFTGIHFRSMVTPTFFEQYHLITINGGSNWTFDGCKFSGWRGDAIYLGSSDAGGVIERHNRNIRVLNCYFDGVNKENRQAISVIDCDGLWVERCYFINCTKSTMPGVIDMEPNANAFHIVRDVWIRDNNFEACGGNVGLVSVFFQSVIPLPENINVVGNIANNCTMTSGGAFFFCNVSRVVTESDIDMGVVVERNQIRNHNGRAYQVRAGKGIRIKNNLFEDVTFGAIFGFTGGTDFVMDVSVQDTFIRVATGAVSAFDVFDATRFDLSGMVMNDCGDGSASASAFTFKDGVSTGVKFNNVTVFSPTAKTKRAVIKDGAHTFTPGTNEHFNCTFEATMLNAFEAVQSNMVWTNYTVLVEGSSNPGTGTYGTPRTGRYRMNGKNVDVQGKVQLSGHTSAGELIEIGAPTLIAASASNSETPISVALSGVATTGGQIGRMNPAAFVNGLSCIRCHHTGTGTLLDTVIPAGTWTAEWSGSYVAA